MNKAESIFKKIINLDVEAYNQGRLNFDMPNDEMEALAKKRLSICQGCKYFKEEPLDDPELKFKDELIPELSEMACGACGCTSSYLLRQNIKPCKKGKW